MFKVLSDPHTVLKFQNLCGLSKVDPSANPLSNGCGSLSSGDGERARHRNIQTGTQNESKSSKVVENGGSQELSYNRYLHGLYFFGSSLGDEAFYTAFFPFVFWNVDEYLGRRLIILWVVSMYVGQILKDILRWPRPASPPVIVIERRYESEYGMPSTHATVATIIPFTLVYFTFGRFEYSLWLGAAFVVFWCCLVCLSRIYMGVHSFQDLIGGIALGVLVLLIAVPFLDVRLELLLKNRHFALPHLFICSLMIYLYPQYTVWTSSRRETARVVGVGCGVLLGFWSVYHLENMAIVDPYEGTPYPFNISTSAVLLCLARCGVGVPVLVLAKLAIKFSMIRILSGALPHTKLSPKEHAAIDIPTVFVTYTAVGFSAAYLVPKLFAFAGTYL